jgi:hypothetical protein
MPDIFREQLLLWQSLLSVHEAGAHLFLQVPEQCDGIAEHHMLWALDVSTVRALD